MISIEQSIFRGLLYNEEFVRKAVPFLEESYFDGGHKMLFTMYKELFEQYNKVPTIEALAITLQKSSVSEQQFDEILEIVERAAEKPEELPDTQWLLDETEQYCQDKAIYNAVYRSIDVLEGNDKHYDKHAIPDILDDALGVSFDTSIGMEFFDDAEKRYELYTTEDDRIRFPLDALNVLSNGGLKPKSLSCILSGPNVGKSSLMCYLAGEFLKAGKNVVYISMEMGEELIQERVDANLLGVKTDDLKNMSREDFLNGINKIKSKTQGKFFAKEYPTGAAHSGHFRHLLKELKQKKKFVPDVVFIDYLNICASSRYKSMSGVNSYSYIKAVSEELRGLGVEFSVPIFTGTQVNRGAHNSDSPDMTSISESFGTAATMDFLIAATTDEVLMENNQQMFHLLKTRWGNKAKIRPQMIGVDFDYMRYYDVGTDASGPTTAEIQHKVGQNKPFKREKSSAIEGIDWE